jgi:hypothetical protein
MLDTYRYTHSEYVILMAFPLQKYLRERASMLCYTRNACLFDNEQKACGEKRITVIGVVT